MKYFNVAGKILSKISGIEDKITEAHALCLERKMLSEKIVTPSLTDRALIPVLYDLFKEILSERDYPPDMVSPYQRRKFLFLILLLYNPGFFAGGKMAFGLRKDLAGCLNLKSGSTISCNCADVLFLYRHYRDFSADMAEIYGKIAERIGF
jgi:hypothetical protein